MYQIIVKLVQLLYDSINQRLLKKIDKQTIRNSIKYDIKRNVFISSIALKVKISAEEIITNINLIDSKNFLDEAAIKHEFIYLRLNKQVHYTLYNDIFNKVLYGNFGCSSSKDLVINLKFLDDKNDNSFSAYRNKVYYQSLFNLLRTTNYKVKEIDNIPVLECFNWITKLQNYIYKSKQTYLFNSKVLIDNDKLSEYAKHISTYIYRCCSKNNEKIITICGNKYSIDTFKRINKLLNLNYSIVLETEPIIIKNNGIKINSNGTVYNKEKIGDEDRFKYFCASHDINRNCIFTANQRTNLDFVQFIYDKLSNLLDKIYEADIIDNQWFRESKWNLFKNDEILFNKICQFDEILNFASKNLRLGVLEQYLFSLCQLSKPLIRSVSIALNHYYKQKYIDTYRLKNKMKIMIIVKYIIHFIVSDIFDINIKVRRSNDL